MRRTVDGGSSETVTKNGRKRMSKVSLDKFTCNDCGEVQVRPLDRNQIPPPGWVHAFTDAASGVSSYRQGDFCPKCALPIIGKLVSPEEYQR